MMDISTFDNYSKINSEFLREHNKITSKYKIDFISLTSVKLPLICLYDIVFLLFKNNLIDLKKSEIILLTLTSVGILAKENSDIVNNLINILKELKLYEYLNNVQKTIKSLKNLVNIIFKKEGAVITNIDQALKYKHTIDVFNYTLTFIRMDDILIEDFCNWYINDQRNKNSQELIDYININYYIL